MRIDIWIEKRGDQRGGREGLQAGRRGEESTVKRRKMEKKEK